MRALSTCVSFISLMQSVNRMQYLDITFLSLVCHHCNHIKLTLKFELNLGIDAIRFTWTMFVSTKVFGLYLDGWFVAFSKKYNIFLLLYRPYIINNFLSFFGDLHLSFGISLSSLMFSVSFVTLSKLSCVKVLETLMILSAISLPIKSPVASAVFSIDFFK